MNGEEVARIFEECWESVVRSFTRMPPIWFSEKDLQARLLCELNRRLSGVNDEHQEELFLAYAEVPVPLNPELFVEYVDYHGRPMRKKEAEFYTADIAIMGWDRAALPIPTLYLIAELKYWPTSIIPLTALALVEEGFVGDIRFDIVLEEREIVTKAIKWIKERQQETPSRRDIDYYLGRRKGRSHVEKMIEIIKAYKEFYEEDVYAYYCIVEDLYQNLEAVLAEEISRYNPPPQFKILFKYIPFPIERLEAYFGT